MVRVTARMLLGIVLLTGCQSQPAAPTTSPASQPIQASDLGPSYKLLSITPANPDGPRDPQSIKARIVHLEVYQLNVPYGTLSRNPAFWKHVDETVVDVPTYEMLFKNGVRVGLAPTSEWPYFRDLIEQNPATVVRSALTAREVSSMELPARKQIESQEIFYFDALNDLTGRSFDRSENFWALSFQPAPRKPGALRIVLCPVVRAMRTVFQVVGGEEFQVREVRPERLYDLNLRADISPEHFLIVGLSTEGQWPTSLGNRFLVQEGEAERFEQILLLVPRVVEDATADAH